MTPLHLLVHADSPENAARIERALRAGAPTCTIETVTDATTLAAALVAHRAEGVVAARPEALSPAPPPPAPGITPELRHELNNHLALIRMLADYLAESKTLMAADAARAREIATATDAAARVLRNTKTAR